MKYSSLLFAIKCSVIVYFAAFTSIDKLGVSHTISNQLVAKKSWKVNCFGTTANDNTCIFEGYAFNFDATGKVTATKNGSSIEGNWLEDNISKKITLNFEDKKSVLSQLNFYWDIATISNAGITFEKSSDRDAEKLYITAL